MVPSSILERSLFTIAVMLVASTAPAQTCPGPGLSAEFLGDATCTRAHTLRLEMQWLRPPVAPGGPGAELVVIERLDPNGALLDRQFINPYNGDGVLRSVVDVPPGTGHGRWDGGAGQWLRIVARQSCPPTFVNGFTTINVIVPDLPECSPGDAATLPSPSQVRPYPGGDTRVVVDTAPALDTQCRFRSAGPILVDVPVARVAGRANDDGTLVDASRLVAEGFLSRFVNVTVRAWDVDPGETDWVYLNGHLLGALRGSNNAWSQNSFRVPVELVRFGRRDGDVNAPGTNVLRIDIDQVTGPRPLCTAADWVSLEFDALAPLFLVHGTDSNPDTWSEHTDIDDYLDSLGVPWARDIVLEPNGTIAENGRLLAAELQRIRTALGAKQGHIVTHSKGGNDSREYLAHYHDPNLLRILSVSTYSTPYQGSAVADVIEAARTYEAVSNNSAIRRLIVWDLNGVAALFTPRGDALIANTTWFMNDYNTANPLPSCCVKWYSFGADADVNSAPNGDLITPEESQGLFPTGTTHLADAAYRVLGTVRTVHANIVGAIPGPGGTPIFVADLVPIPVPPNHFEENDLAVTVTSARNPVGTALPQINGNHGTMKNSTTLRTILSRIRSDFPVRQP